jgi:DNA-binding CsgD family transcriptional regulator
MRDLSPRQREILALVAAGRTSKEIASALGISESTVNWHLANVFERLGASSRAEAVALAMREEVDGGDRPPPVAATSTQLPSLALALALTLLLLGLLAGALIAGWTIAWP